MMNIRRALAVVAIPFVIGTFGFVAPNQVNAKSPSNRRVEISQQRPRPHNESQRPDEKPQLKHRQPRQKQKKHLPQPHNQDAGQNRVGHNNR
ncbi:hypothetical protein [Nostoc sp. PA-18-2419]|uniref:hypothetical protein n=1 Tax=Nostoc sp. PA-18-2419 TaxID=2575443 RepID=UPI0011080615|nr:hypothetical protein [Nostoc sp. PA-18-2419]